MKLTTGIVAMAMMAGGAWAQSPDAIDNARSAVKSLQQQQASGTTTAKPAPGAPAPTVKPAAIPGENPAAKPAAASAPNKLRHVNVVPGTNDVQIEVTSTENVTPKILKLSSPSRVVLELPATALGTSQNKIPVGSGGVKGVRIGMDGKTPPTTSVVVDLEKSLAFELAPGAAGKIVLILHTEDSGATVAKSTPVVPAPVSKPAAAVAKAATPSTPAAAPKIAEVKAPAPKPAAATKVADAKAPATKPEMKVADSKMPAPNPVPAMKVADAKAPAAKPGAPTAKSDSKAKTVIAAKPGPAVPVPVKVAEAPKPKPEEKKWAMSGKRDPFFSPVVQQQGSGCSTGKKCLEIGTINLRGVVKSDSGFIAVVTNNLNKAYFLRENDPVFNGYVVKITGDSVVFQETIQDKLGKAFTREVVKRIFTPAV
jgi:hypothetical protein